MELPECGAACRSLLAQQPSQGLRDGGEGATALHRKCSGGKGAEEGPWDLHGGRRQQPAPESQEENHQHRCLALIRPPAVGAAGPCIPYQCFEEQYHPGTLRAMAGCGPESARIGAGGIDLPGGRGGRRGLNCQPNQPLTA